MTAAWIPIAILGLPFLGILFLSALFKGGTTASWAEGDTARRSPELELISQLSGPVSPGAISRLSGHTSPGAISQLSAPRPVGAIARLSAGFYASKWFGLPLLTRSQEPLEPDDSLLIPDHSSTVRNNAQRRSFA